MHLSRPEHSQQFSTNRETHRSTDPKHLKIASNKGEALWKKKFNGVTITVTMRTSIQDVKWEAWHDLNFERRLLGKRQIFSEGGWGGGCIFFTKNKLKSEIFDDKKLLSLS